MISTILSNEVKCAYTNFYQEINRSVCQCFSFFCIFLCIKWSTKNLSSTGPWLEQFCSGPRLLASGLPKWAQLSSSPGPPWGYSKEGKDQHKKISVLCQSFLTEHSWSAPLAIWMAGEMDGEPLPISECSRNRM